MATKPKTLSSARVREIIAGAPEGTDPAGIVQALRDKGYALEGYEAPATFGFDPKTGLAAQAAELLAPGEPGDPVRRRLTAAIPQALGMGGGAVGFAAGGPAGAAGGAALGGMAGQALRRNIDAGFGDPLPVGLEGAADVGLEGGAQGLAELLGIGAAGAARGTARGLMRTAAPEGRAAARIASQRGLRPMEDVMLEEGLSVGDPIRPRMLGGKSGREGVEGALREAGGAQEAILARAERAGVRHDPADITRSIADEIETAQDYPLTSRERQKIMRMTEDFLGDHPELLTPKDLDKAVRHFQKKSRGVYAAIGAGANEAEIALERAFNKALAKVGRRELIGEGASPTSAQPALGGMAAARGRTGDLIRAERAIGEADLSRPVRPFGPGGLNLPLVAGVPLSRNIVSRGAHAVNAPAVAATLRQSPRLLEALVEQLMLDAEGRSPGLEPREPFPTLSNLPPPEPR